MFISGNNELSRMGASEAMSITAQKNQVSN